MLRTGEKALLLEALAINSGLSFENTKTQLVKYLPYNITERVFFRCYLGDASIRVGK